MNNEQEFFDALRSGDKDAWEKLYNLTKGKAFRALRGKRAGEEDAKDAFQNAMIHFLAKIESFEFYAGLQGLQNHLINIAKFKLLEIWKHPERRYKEPLAPDYLSYLYESDPNLQHLFRMSPEGCRQMIIDALNSLKGRNCKYIIEARHWNELTLEAIADKLKLTYGHIRNHSPECEKELQQTLNKMGYFEKCPNS